MTGKCETNCKWTRYASPSSSWSSSNHILLKTSFPQLSKVGWEKLSISMHIEREDKTPLKLISRTACLSGTSSWHQGDGENLFLTLWRTAMLALAYVARLFAQLFKIVPFRSRDWERSNLWYTLVTGKLWKPKDNHNNRFHIWHVTCKKGSEMVLDGCHFHHPCWLVLMSCQCVVWEDFVTWYGWKFGYRNTELFIKY